MNKHSMKDVHQIHELGKISKNWLSGRNHEEDEDDDGYGLIEESEDSTAFLTLLSWFESSTSLLISHIIFLFKHLRAFAIYVTVTLHVGAIMAIV
jgi:hypothetical protein